MAERNAANVLPDPVGAAMSVCLRLLIEGHACSCGGVGSLNCLANQFATAGWKRLRVMHRPAHRVGCNLRRIILVEDLIRRSLWSCTRVPDQFYATLILPLIHVSGWVKDGHNDRWIIPQIRDPRRLGAYRNRYIVRCVFSFLIT